ncbi:hypothetical protein PHYSODRAFT_315506 [Phytophthora sojae]|uniref:FYVE-type domain-containing protein n=1 Tax=Phytophthora sojae (strain P6497) TaxID=1094619 RepID=G4ZMU5_PHYSP|nr:hypothetical protein PHYSODRAFT_315506 [Phytophthora sojae]EGZ14668.1 hypothetical protein PHYSODRAFT_315506 [Phytophthora sojae]|eukprot:XP_009528417.1 hypothetical protein PHYSODRAFT_315506 [Phytophthora sojae]
MAVAGDTYGRRWRQGHRRHGVDLFELSTASGDQAVDEDRDIAYAVVAKVELRCHLNEVLNGDVLFSQRRLLSSELRRQSVVASRLDMEKQEEEESPEQALIGVNVATLRPRMPVDLGGTNKKTQKLCFSTFTQQYPGQDRAVHIMKTLLKELHDQLIPRSDRTALRNEVDHLSVGFHIQSTHSSQGFAGSNTHVTRIFAHGYASPTLPTQFGESTKSSDATSVTPAELARRRETIMNPEAKHVLNVLTKSLRQFERVVRRRRFGFQTFIYFPTGYDDLSLEKACSICAKRFHFFRRDFFCHLCGHMACGDCSQLYEVEARVGELRRNRCCLQCVHRVDSCTFDDEDLLEALGPAVVAVDDALWYNDDKYHLDAMEGDGDTASMTSDSSYVEELTEQLYSDDPSQNSHALDFLGQLGNPVASIHEYDFVSPDAKRAKAHNKSKRRKNVSKVQLVAQGVENYLSQSLRVMKDRFIRADKTKAVDHPMPPMPAPKKEVRRLEVIEQMGVLQPEYDHAALDLVAQVAAKRLNCPIGFVSVVDNDNSHAIGTYNLPEEAFTLPRTINVCIHAVYAEKPLILKNPMRDMRYSQMPCVKDLGVKFYAGFPVHGPNGEVVASLCAADAVPYDNISTKDYATMEVLATLASELVAPKKPVLRC